MASIYAKTQQGQQEIETRALRLPARLRSTLILVDGKRSDAELGRLVPNVGEVLQALLEAGLIEVTQTVSSRSSPPPAPAPAAPAAAPTPAAAPREDITKLRRDAVRALTDLLGPDAEALAMRIEKAADAETLAPLLERAVTLVANARGGSAAAQFAARFLPPRG